MTSGMRLNTSRPLTSRKDRSFRSSIDLWRPPGKISFMDISRWTNGPRGVTVTYKDGIVQILVYPRLLSRYHRANKANISSLETSTQRGTKILMTLYDSSICDETLGNQHLHARPLQSMMGRTMHCRSYLTAAWPRQDLQVTRCSHPSYTVPGQNPLSRPLMWCTVQRRYRALYTIPPQGLRKLTSYTVQRQNPLSRHPMWCTIQRRYQALCSAPY